MPEIKDSYYLQQAFNFTDADLKANRAGYMTEAQIRHIRKENTVGILVIAGIFLVLVTFVIFIISNLWDEASIINRIMVALVGALPFYFLALFLYHIRRLLRPGSDLWHIDEEVIALTGTVHTVRVKRNNRNYQTKLRVGVDEKLFTISNRVLYAVQGGRIYTIYYTVETKHILSMELSDREFVVRKAKDELKYLESQAAILKAKNDEQ